MKPLTSCCCFDLRTGGLILGWMGVISGVCNIATILNLFAVGGHNPIGLGASLFFVVLFTMFELLWICGINKKNSCQMLPSLIVALNGFMVLSLCGAALIIVIFLRLAVALRHTDANVQTFAILMALVMLVLVLLVLALAHYLTAVKFYLYKEIKQANQEIPPESNNGVV